MIKHIELISTRTDNGSDSVEVVATIHFAGPGATAGDVLDKRFLDPLRSQLAVLADDACASLSYVHESHEQAFSRALESALSEADPRHHAAIRQRFGAPEPATGTRPEPHVSR